MAKIALGLSLGSSPLFKLVGRSVGMSYGVQPWGSLSLINIHPTDSAEIDS